MGIANVLKILALLQIAASQESDGVNVWQVRKQSGPMSLASFMLARVPTFVARSRLISALPSFAAHHSTRTALSTSGSRNSPNRKMQQRGSSKISCSMPWDDVVANIAKGAGSRAGKGSARYAVLVDADNIDSSYMPPVMEELEKFGTSSIRCVYGDFPSGDAAAWKKVALEYSFRSMNALSFTEDKKSSHQAMIIDAMDILHTNKAVDGFALVSSSCDFTCLAQRLREAGKHVVGLGRKSTPKPFVKACDDFIILDDLKGHEQEPVSAREVKRTMMNSTTSPKEVQQDLQATRQNIAHQLESMQIAALEASQEQVEEDRQTQRPHKSSTNDASRNNTVVNSSQQVQLSSTAKVPHVSDDRNESVRLSRPPLATNSSLASTDSEANVQPPQPSLASNASAKLSKNETKKVAVFAEPEVNASVQQPHLSPAIPTSKPSTRKASKQKSKRLENASEAEANTSAQDALNKEASLPLENTSFASSALRQDLEATKKNIAQQLESMQIAAEEASQRIAAEEAKLDKHEKEPPQVATPQDSRPSVPMEEEDEEEEEEEEEEEKEAQGSPSSDHVQEPPQVATPQDSRASVPMEQEARGFPSNDQEPPQVASPKESRPSVPKGAQRSPSSDSQFEAKSAVQKSPASPRPPKPPARKAQGQEPQQTKTLSGAPLPPGMVAFGSTQAGSFSQTPEEVSNIRSEATSGGQGSSPFFGKASAPAPSFGNMQGRDPPPTEMLSGGQAPGGMVPFGGASPRQAYTPAPEAEASSFGTAFASPSSFGNMQNRDPPPPIKSLSGGPLPGGMTPFTGAGSRRQDFAPAPEGNPMAPEASSFGTASASPSSFGNMQGQDSPPTNMLSGGQVPGGMVPFGSSRRTQGFSSAPEVHSRAQESFPSVRNTQSQGSFPSERNMQSQGSFPSERNMQSQESQEKTLSGAPLPSDFVPFGSRPSQGYNAVPEEHLNVRKAPPSARRPSSQPGQGLRPPSRPQMQPNGVVPFRLKSGQSHQAVPTGQNLHRKSSGASKSASSPKLGDNLQTSGKLSSPPKSVLSSPSKSVSSPEVGNNPQNERKKEKDAVPKRPHEASNTPKADSTPSTTEKPDTLDWWSAYGVAPVEKTPGTNQEQTKRQPEQTENKREDAEQDAKKRWLDRNNEPFGWRAPRKTD